MLWNSHSRKTVPVVYRDHYESHARLTPGSVKRYRCELGRWERFVGPVQVRSVETEHFADFRTRATKEGLKPGTVESTIKIVKAVLRYCRDRGWINRLPLWGRALPDEPPEPEPATLDELDQLYRAAEHARILGCGLVSPAQGMRAWLALDLWTGLRLTDISSRLAWSHIQPDRGCIRFQASKTGKRHLFPLTPVVSRHLELLSPDNGPLLFGVGNPHRIDVELARLCAAAGIRKLTAQNIRQASVTQWDALGVGHLIHGCGLKDQSTMPQVMRHYLGVLDRLSQVADRFPWPESMLDRRPRQQLLFG